MVDVKKILAELNLDEKALLTAGDDMWSTPPIERLEIPRIRMTDGPNGARGAALLGIGEATAVCIPCGSALGATWNPELIERVGEMLGQEARTKSCRVLLAPTINLHRSPLGGRNFECYSEDPWLSGKIAAGFVRGVQSQGVVTTAKHFVANDAEFERNTIDSRVDERTLREIYLVPFELAVKEGGALGIMTAYNRLNGVYCSENAWLLDGVLRADWGFEGFVLTDWLSAGSATLSAAAGLDLQMPGPGRFFGAPLAEAVRREEVSEERVDRQVRNLLEVWERIGALAEPSSASEASVDLPEHRALARETATEGMVLLRNEALLPLARGTIRRLAVIGPNADRGQIMGGGSAELRPHYRVAPLEAFRANLGDEVEIVFERGCWTEKKSPEIQAGVLHSDGGEGGFDVQFFAGIECEGESVYAKRYDDGQLLFFAPPSEAIPDDGFSFRALARLHPNESGRHAITMMQTGGARLYVDGELVLDGVANSPARGDAYFGMASVEIEAEIELAVGRAVELRVDYRSEGAAFMHGVRLGLRPPRYEDSIERACEAASSADAVVLLVGTNSDWESEGDDRKTMDLPGEQDELIRRVCRANPRSVVCVNAGSPTRMDWADAPGAILQIWFGGQEMSNALVDVLFGDAEPSGRLPTSFPLELEHNPSFGNFPGENSRLDYGEGLLIGYRWYETRDLAVRYPFGHGLSYTRFEVAEPWISSDRFRAGEELSLRVPIRNVGERRGSEVIQCYVAPLSSRLFRPRRELRGFAKLSLEPGEEAEVTLTLADRAFAYWDPGDLEYAAMMEKMDGVGPLVPSGGGAERHVEAGWYLDAGRYEIQIARSSAETLHRLIIEIPEDAGPLQR